jgi:hypothetical protein
VTFSGLDELLSLISYNTVVMFTWLRQKNHTNHGKIEFSLFEIEIGNFIKSNRLVIYVTKSLLLRIFYLHNA